MIKKVLELKKKNVKELLKEKIKFRNKCRKGKVKRIMNYYFQKKEYSYEEIEKYWKFLRLYNIGEIFLPKYVRRKIKEGGKINYIERLKLNVANQYLVPFILKKRIEKEILVLIKRQEKDKKIREMINIYRVSKLIDINYEEEFENPIIGLVLFYLFYSDGISEKEIDKLHSFFKNNIVDIEKILKD